MEINFKIQHLQSKVAADMPIKIGIIGLGSVGNYLLDYLISSNLNVEIHLLGRSKDKMQSDLNIALVAADIRKCRHVVCKIWEIDLNNIDEISETLKKVDLDFIVNSSRAYSHLKYGSISWHTVRAYGIWSPLSVKYIKNIMQGVSQSGTNPIVINTSYSDATNAWIKTAGLDFPDFGSGNLNHLTPRIRFAVANLLQINDVENIDITLATSHFHDVVISKEGQTEGVNPLVHLNYKGDALELDMAKVYAACAISMPTDAKRNMMNASSNYEIITKIISAVTGKTEKKLHIPGAFGMLGGYPVVVDGMATQQGIHVKETYFSLSEMQQANAQSIYLDGIERVENGYLYYTDELISKTQKHFGYQLPKKIHLSDSNEVADEIIKNVIKKA